MCRIFPAPRLEHNPLHAELSVTNSAFTSSDKSDMRPFNPSAREARELVKKIESHLRREALQPNLQQNNAYNPSSKDSKAMIREMGNVKLLRCSDAFFVGINLWTFFD